MSRIVYEFSHDQLGNGQDQLSCIRYADGEFAYVHPLTFYTPPPGSPSDGDVPMLTDWSITGSDVFAFLQGAMDMAWELGLRPTKAVVSDVEAIEVKKSETGESASPTSEEMAAVRAHLEDMRQVAIRLLDAGVRPQAMEFAE